MDLRPGSAPEDICPCPAPSDAAVPSSTDRDLALNTPKLRNPRLLLQTIRNSMGRLSPKTLILSVRLSVDFFVNLIVLLRG